MTVFITINDAAMNALRAAADMPFKQNATRIGLDQWRVPIEQETVDRMDAARSEGESYSDLILKATQALKTGGRRQ